MCAFDCEVKSDYKMFSFVFDDLKILLVVVVVLLDIGIWCY